MFCLHRSAVPGGALFEGPDHTIVQSPDQQLTHASLACYQYMIASRWVCPDPALSRLAPPGAVRTWYQVWAFPAWPPGRAGRRSPASTPQLHRSDVVASIRHPSRRHPRNSRRIRNESARRGRPQGGQPLSLETVDLDGPRAGEVLVEIKATGICHTDEFTLSGADPEGFFPPILGHEGAGIVVGCRARASPA